MWELFLKGGVVMYPIALCSIVALGVFLERCWTYLQVGKQTGQLAHEVEPLAAKSLLDEALAVCHRSSVPLAGIFLVALRNAGRPRAEIKAAVDEAGQREASQLMRFLGLLSTIATLAALLGLLGTVTGSGHTLRVYVGRLRHKLESDPARPKHLLTETGVGYRMEI